MISFKMNMPFYLMVFYGSFMILAVLVLRWLLKNRLPKFVFPTLWGVILLRLLIPFSLSSPLSLKVPEFATNIPYEAAFAENTNIAEDVIAIQEKDTPPAEGTALSAQSEAVVEDATNINCVIPQEATLSIAYASDPYKQGRNTSIVLFIYFTGALATATILMAQKYRYTRLLKNALLVEHNETINTILREMDMGHILVFTNDEIASPLVCGLLTPRIYLPTRMDFGNITLLRYILRHETMHIRRKDNWLKAVMLLTLPIHWFNPLVWAMSRALASDLEMACDEALLRLYDRDSEAEEHRKGYALSLLTMAITKSRPTLLYSAFSRTEVERRIQGILHYHKPSALLLAFSICLLLGGSVVFATGGQAPFETTLTSYCSSNSCRWGVRVNLTRDISLGKNAQDRAERLIFDVMHEDTTNDPDLLKAQLLSALADTFHVERSAFALDISLCLDDRTLYEEYAAWGLVRSNEENDLSLLYNGETIRTFSDEMIGRYMSGPEGAVDLTVERNRLGEIIAVNVFREGDTVYDRRTKQLGQGLQRYAQTAPGDSLETELDTIPITGTADSVTLHNYTVQTK